jgi:hypothetical protein
MVQVVFASMYMEVEVTNFLVPFLNSKTSTNARCIRILKSFLFFSPSSISSTSLCPYFHKYSCEDAQKENAVMHGWGSRGSISSLPRDLNNQSH